MTYSTPIEKNRNVALLVIFILSLAIKIAILYFAAEPVIFNKYPYFAEHLGHGIGIGERILDLSPLYLYITTIFFKIFGPNWDLLALIQILLGSLNCVFIYLIGSKIFDDTAGLIAAAFLMLYGNITLIELTLEPEVLLLFFNSLAVIALLKAGNMSLAPFRSWRWLLAGALVGFSAITKANALLMIPGAAIWVWLSVSVRRNRFMAVAYLLLGTLIVISPVTIRNYLQFKDFVLITADGGKVFFHGNGPGATGMERADLSDQGFIEERQAEPDYAHALFRETARKLSKAPLKPSECADFWFDRTLKYMREQPEAAIGLAWKKFCLFWNNYEVHDLDTTYKDYLALKRWPLLSFGLLSVLGLLGMGSTLSRFRHAFLIYWMVLVYLLSVTVFLPASRYRLPAVPFLSIFAAGYIRDWFHFIRQKKVLEYVTPLVLIPILLAWSYMPFRHEIALFDRWQQASRIHYSLGGRMLFNKGEYHEAIEELEQVISVAPDFAPPYNYMGKAYAILGDFPRAQNCFLRVIALSPEIDEGFLNLGLLFELKGEFSKAISCFEKALTLNPNNPKTRQHLVKLEETVNNDPSVRMY